MPTPVTSTAHTHKEFSRLPFEYNFLKAYKCSYSYSSFSRYSTLNLVKIANGDGQKKCLSFLNVRFLLK